MRRSANENALSATRDDLKIDDVKNDDVKNDEVETDEVKRDERCADIRSPTKIPQRSDGASF